MLNPSIFRSYDIRGLVDQDLIPETVNLIGKGYGTFIQKISGKNIVIGGDNRSSTEKFRQYLTDGLLSTGCNVTNIGISMSPMLYFANYFYKFDGGIQITGSHNPIEFNGFKLVKKGLDSVFGDEIQEIKEIIEQKQFIQGQGRLEKKEIFADYQKEIFQRIELNRKIKAVVDCGNGTGSFFIPGLLRGLGLEIVELYCTSDPTFPNHLPDPEVEANLRDLMQKVIEEKADLGIAFDGDADRVGIVDEKGKRYEADELMLILAKDLLTRHKDMPIVVDVKYSQAVIDKINQLGGKAIIWKTGYPNIKNKMQETGSLLGGEVSGHVFLKEDYFGFDDATFAVCKILEIFSQTRVPFSDLFKDLPKIFSTPEIKTPCPDEKKVKIVEELIDYFKSKYNCILVDGVRIQLDDGSWGLVRYSNTNPYLTLRFEAPTQKRLDQAKAIIINELKKYKEVDLSEVK